SSGTAAVELHPAIVEAHQSAVPLIAATADRPPELQGVGAPQTIDQQHLYGGSVRWFVDAGVPSEATRGAWRSLASRAVAEALGAGGRGPGPVHVNLPFRDPLVGDPGELPEGRDGGRPWHTVVDDRSDLDDAAVDTLARALDVVRGVVVAGRGAGGVGVHALAEKLGWPVLADARSGARVPARTTVGAFDSMLRHRRFAADHRPEVVLRVGEQPASKVLAQWLAASGAREVVVHRRGVWIDPDHTADLVVAADPPSVIAALAKRLAGSAGASTPWLARWTHAEEVAQRAIESAVAAIEGATEPGVARALMASLPDGASLVLSSSMPVRDVEWFAAPRAGVDVFSNRGANGIDGVVSTAVGVALATRRPTALLVGDVALLHDTNGMLMASTRGIDLTIVVVDNDGGGIFSFLPQATELAPEVFERLFGTPHGVDLAALAAVHGIPEVAAVGEGSGVRIVRVRTDRSANVEAHDRVNRAVVDALG
ncbi:MAG TPA: 2-succinyl-5-enolpyruvyl-6-hydroxy-3-cyclohexene-1-carboxylic-acid synthase, partial [Acidimicrobiales bacterium]|nr:2-succinyl-5-enolpyruvyl-6-hydroxy-3-cyclohexene-1-carboxylic-acid synthase [Acidimicrobiales bacterium]